jgi:hypothetical protein
VIGNDPIHGGALVFSKVAAIAAAIMACSFVAASAADKSRRFEFISPMLEKSPDFGFVDAISGTCYANNNKLECKLALFRDIFLKLPPLRRQILEAN